MGKQPKSKWTADSLSKEVVGATKAECERFVVGFPEDAKDKLEAYLDWRQLHQVDDVVHPEDSNDMEDWLYAVKMTFSHHGTMRAAEGSQLCPARSRVPCRARRGSLLMFSERVSRRHETGSAKTIPQLLFLQQLPSGQPLRDTEGRRVIHNLPARMDVDTFSPDVLATAMAIYLDRKCDRESMESFTIMIDVRPGEGWPNPSAFQIVGFIGDLANGLYDLYPQRVHRCILFPVPRPAIFLWKSISVFLDPQLTATIDLIPGGCALKSPPPTKQLKTYVSEVGVTMMERTRLDAFVRPGLVVVEPPSQQTSTQPTIPGKPSNDRVRTKTLLHGVMGRSQVEVA